MPITITIPQVTVPAYDVEVSPFNVQLTIGSNYMSVGIKQGDESELRTVDIQSMLAAMDPAQKIVVETFYKMVIAQALNEKLSALGHPGDLTYSDITEAVFGTV